LLIIAGQAHPVLGHQYLQQLRELARELGVERLVSFHSTFMLESDLLHLYQVCAGVHGVHASRAMRSRLLRAAPCCWQSADVFVCAHTSAEQTSSGTMLFAMTSGAAVVATPFAQAAELLANGNGMLVPFNDSVAIARAVRLHPTVLQSHRLSMCIS
jgi:glycosyltransferase involved in cell wall biosynthesis